MSTQTSSGGVRSPDAVELALDARLGRYTIEALLGRGGMGVVYRARDPDLGRSVALKVLRGQPTDAGRARLLREAQVMAQLVHPNVITVFEIGTSSDRDFIVMELIDGVTLDTWAKTRTHDQIVRAFRDAARGLAAAHAKGLVHRDFKPSNVLVGRDDRVVVTDFGLARPSEGSGGNPPELDAAIGIADTGVAEPSGAPRESSRESSKPWLSPLTATGSLLGTPAYMAPEQWTGDEVDGRTDQYAFCIALWEALERAHPRRAHTVDELRALAVAGTFPESTDAIPAWIVPILRHGMAVRPADRWPSMIALCDALERGRHRRRRRGLAALGVVGVVALGAGAFALATRTDAPPPVAPTVDAVDARLEQALGKLIALPTEPGNACADYFAAVATPVPDASDAAAEAVLQRLRLGATKRTCTIIGLLLPWSALDGGSKVKDGPTFGLLAASKLIGARANELARTGDTAAAIRWLAIGVVIGLQLQREPELLIGMVGISIATGAIAELVTLDPLRAPRWSVVAGLLNDRRYGDVDRFKALAPDDVEGAAILVESPDLLPGVRAASIAHVARAHGEVTPRQRELLERWTHLPDPRLAAVATHFRATILRSTQ